MSELLGDKFFCFHELRYAERHVKRERSGHITTEQTSR